MESGDRKANVDILQNKRRNSALTKEEAEAIKRKNKQKELSKIQKEEARKKGIPSYFEDLLSYCDLLLNRNYQNPQNFPIKKLLLLVSISEKNRRNDIKERHLLDSSYLAVINATDKESSKKAVRYYNKIINKY